jgi:hypothetical protein
MKKNHWYQESIESRLENTIKVIIHTQDYNCMGNVYTTIWHRAKNPRSSTTYFDIYKNGELRASSYIKDGKKDVLMSKLYWHGYLTLSDQILVRQILEIKTSIGTQNPNDKYKISH